MAVGAEDLLATAGEECGINAPLDWLSGLSRLVPSQCIKLLVNGLSYMEKIYVIIGGTREPQCNTSA